MFFNLFSFKAEKKTIEVINVNNQFEGNFKSIANALGVGYKLAPRSSSKSPRLYVLDFNGDIMATQSEALTHEVSSIICAANPGLDEVLVRIQSPGGAAHAYGYAASQLERIKNSGLKLTVAVDRIAASGGYMMACVGDKIISAPYAIIGSIGVVAEFPNFNALMKEVGIEYKQYTAGKFKRTVSPLGKITEEGEKKFREDLEDMYSLFRDHVSKHRESVNIDEVSSGEHWSAIRAKSLGLVDEITTSEEYMLEKINSHDILKIRYIGNKKSFSDKLSEGFANSIVSIITRTVIGLYSHLRYGF
jgi:serine protease SohB